MPTEAQALLTFASSHRFIMVGLLMTNVLVTAESDDHSCSDITLAFTNKPLSHPGAQQAQDLVLRFLAAPAETAERAIKRQSRGVYIRTPIHSLNTMLHGGWPVGQLSGISSAQAVGKTVSLRTSSFVSLKILT